MKPEGVKFDEYGLIPAIVQNFAHTVLTLPTLTPRA